MGVEIATTRKISGNIKNIVINTSTSVHNTPNDVTTRKYMI